MLLTPKMKEQYQEQAFKEVFDPLDRSLQEALQALSPLNGQQLNTVPFPGSWTAGQVTRHIIKSNSSIGQALSLPGNTTGREPDQRVQELKDLFLDFTIKFEAAPFITPRQEVYEKERLVADLGVSTTELKKASRVIELDQAIHHPAFGEITKLELLYFVLFHTVRHVRQLKKIVAIAHSK
jgi:hypothetical protein